MNLEPASLHRLKNKIAIILGFCELLLESIANDDPRRADVMQIQIAARAALAELPPLPAVDLSGTIGTAPKKPSDN